MASLVLVSTRAAFVDLSPNFGALFLSHLVPLPLGAHSDQC